MTLGMPGKTMATNIKWAQCCQAIVTTFSLFTVSHS